MSMYVEIMGREETQGNWMIEKRQLTDRTLYMYNKVGSTGSQNKIISTLCK